MDWAVAIGSLCGQAGDKQMVSDDTRTYLFQDEVQARQKRVPQCVYSLITTRGSAWGEGRGVIKDENEGSKSNFPCFSSTNRGGKLKI